MTWRIVGDDGETIGETAIALSAHDAARVLLLTARLQRHGSDRCNCDLCLRAVAEVEAICDRAARRRRAEEA